MYAALFSMFFFITLYLQQVLGDDPIQAGLSFLPMTLAVFAGSTLAPRLVEQIRRSRHRQRRHARRLDRPAAAHRHHSRQ